MRILLNNGQNLPTNQTCNSADNVKIDQILNATTLRRNLRNENRNKDRKLWPAYCKNNCAGFAQNTCRATGCKGYRRDLEEDRDLQSTMNCTAQIKDINTKLTQLVTNRQVTSNCRALLNAPRNISCYDDVIYGQVEYMKVWDTRGVVVLDGTPGMTFCRGPLFNVEVVVNNCVDRLDTVVTGPSGFNIATTTYNFPYLGTIDGNVFYQTGKYTVITTPDGFPHKAKSCVFEVKNC